MSKKIKFTIICLLQYIWIFIKSFAPIFYLIIPFSYFLIRIWRRNENNYEKVGDK